MKYTYYLQDDQTQSVRRFPENENIGERWSRETQTWTTECATRRACELTHDAIISERGAQQLL